MAHRSETASALSLAVLFFMTGCISITPRSEAVNASTSQVIPQMPLLHWGIESCGPGALATVLEHFGDSRTMADWERELPKSRGGVLSLDLVVAARLAGFDASLVTGSEESVLAALQEGRPLIGMLQVIDAPGHRYDFFHYIVFDGFDPATHTVRAQFGDGRPRWIHLARIEKAWAATGHTLIAIQPMTEAQALRTGVSLEESGSDEEAANTYHTFLQRQPDSFLAWTNLGNVEVRLGKNAEAEASFRKALEVNPDYREALNNLAWLLFTESRYAEAERFARSALALTGPDTPMIRDTLAQILGAEGKCQEALHDISIALNESAGAAKEQQQLKNTKTRLSTCASPEASR